MQVSTENEIIELDLTGDINEEEIKTSLSKSKTLNS